jgi:hypothetical protein
VFREIRNETSFAGNPKRKQNKTKQNAQDQIHSLTRVSYYMPAIQDPSNFTECIIYLFLKTMQFVHATVSVKNIPFS